MKPRWHLQSRSAFSCVSGLRQISILALCLFPHSSDLQVRGFLLSKSGLLQQGVMNHFGVVFCGAFIERKPKTYNLRNFRVSYLEKWKIKIDLDWLLKTEPGLGLLWYVHQGIRALSPKCPEETKGHRLWLASTVLVFGAQHRYHTECGKYPQALHVQNILTVHRGQNY